MQGLDPLSEVVLAWRHNGRLLAPDHGYPLRVVIPGGAGLGLGLGPGLGFGAGQAEVRHDFGSCLTARNRVAFERLRSAPSRLLPAMPQATLAAAASSGSPRLSCRQVRGRCTPCGAP